MQQDSTVEAICSGCSTAYRVSDRLVGKKVACKKCGVSFEIAPPDESCPIIGKLALRYRFIRQDQLDAAIDAFNVRIDPASGASIEDFLVEGGFISERQRSVLLNARDYLEIRQQDKEIGQIMVRKGLCDQRQVEEALAEQSRRFKETQAVCRIDDILSGRGVPTAVEQRKAGETSEPPSMSEACEERKPVKDPVKTVFGEQEELRIQGDIDQETGDIDFNGHVVVSGCITRGYRVKSVSLDAAEVSGGEVDVSGDLVVSGGIVGGEIRAKGTVKAKYIKKSRISAYGNVSVEKEINESEIITSGACNIPIGTILSSEIAAKMGVIAGDIGTEMSNPTKLKVGVDEHIEKELQSLDAALQEKGRILEKLKEAEQELLQVDQDLYARITELAQVQDRSTIEKRGLQKTMEAERDLGDPQAFTKTALQIKDLEDRIKSAEEEIGKRFEERDGVSEQLKSVAEKIRAAEEEIEKLKDSIRFVSALLQRQEAIPKVTIYGSIIEGTVVTTPHATKVLPRSGVNLMISEVKKASSGAEGKWEIGVFFRKKEDTASHAS
jgi:hypothetical protein